MRYESLVEDFSDIHIWSLVDNLHTSTPLDTSDIASHDDIFRSPRRPSCSTPLDAALPPTSSVLAAHETRPPPRRWPYSGRPRFRCHVSILPAVIQRRHAIRLHLHWASLLLPLCRASHIHNRSYLSIFLCLPIICLSVFWSKRRTFRKGTGISSIREHFSSVCHLSDDTFRVSTTPVEMENSGTHFGDGELRVHTSRVHILATTYVLWQRRYYGNVRILVTYVFWRRTYFGDVRISGDNTFGDEVHGFQVRRMENSGQRFRRTRIPSTNVGEHSGFRGSGRRRMPRTRFSSGLRIAPKLRLTLCVIYMWRSLNKVTA